MRNRFYQLPLQKEKISASSSTPLSLSPSRSPPFQVLVNFIFAISIVSDTPPTSPLPPPSPSYSFRIILFLSLGDRCYITTIINVNWNTHLAKTVRNAIKWDRIAKDIPPKTPKKLNWQQHENSPKKWITFSTRITCRSASSQNLSFSEL